MLQLLNQRSGQQQPAREEVVKIRKEGIRRAKIHEHNVGL
jgi:hypothetical protein